MEYWLAATMYALGSLFMVTHFEPEEGSSSIHYFLLVFCWPVLTLWYTFLDLIGAPGNED